MDLTGWRKVLGDQDAEQVQHEKALHSTHMAVANNNMPATDISQGEHV